MTELLTKMVRREGSDLGHLIYPADGSKDAEKRDGARGFLKTLTLGEMIGIASRMEERPNIIVKAGLNAKWYLKSFPKERIDEEFENNRTREGVKNCTLWVWEW